MHTLKQKTANTGLLLYPKYTPKKKVLWCCSSFFLRWVWGDYSSPKGKKKVHSISWESLFLSLPIDGWSDHEDFLWFANWQWWSWAVAAVEVSIIWHSFGKNWATFRLWISYGSSFAWMVSFLMLCGWGELGLGSLFLPSWSWRRKREKQRDGCVCVCVYLFR